MFKFRSLPILISLTLIAARCPLSRWTSARLRIDTPCGTAVQATSSTLPHTTRTCCVIVCVCCVLVSSVQPSVWLGGKHTCCRTSLSRCTRYKAGSTVECYRHSTFNRYISCSPLHALSSCCSDEGVGAARRCVGIVAADGRQWRADRVLVACGAWTPSLVPETRSILRPVPQPIVLFRYPRYAVPARAYPLYCIVVTERPLTHRSVTARGSRCGVLTWPAPAGTDSPSPNTRGAESGQPRQGAGHATAPHAPQAGARIAATERGRFEAFVHNELRLTGRAVLIASACVGIRTQWTGTS